MYSTKSSKNEKTYQIKYFSVLLVLVSNFRMLRHCRHLWQFSAFFFIYKIKIYFLLLLRGYCTCGAHNTVKSLEKLSVCPVSGLYVGMCVALPLISIRTTCYAPFIIPHLPFETPKSDRYHPPVWSWLRCVTAASPFLSSITYATMMEGFSIKQNHKK